MTIRVRYAPSPTGTLHVGNARTALFNWLYARSLNGTFIVRIEDTDPERSKDEFLQDIIDSLRWLKLDWDEGPEVGGDYGPYFQSQRGEIYQRALKKLIDEDKAYYCYCTPDELNEKRQTARAEKKAFRYDRNCGDLTEKQIEEYKAEGRIPALRFRMPRDGAISFDDMVRGTVEINARELDDLIIARPDGSPTYNFVCAVDDSEMAITHVIRGEDHISNTPKQILIARALGFDSPTFCHLPMILGADKSKLSKRHGATSVTDYRQLGYLSEVMDNFMALLGWSYDDSSEIFSLSELVENFSIERVAKKGAVFDMEKFTWMNGLYMRDLSPAELFDRCKPWLVEAGLFTDDDLSAAEYGARALALEHEKIKLLSDAPELVDFFFDEDFEYSAKAEKNVNKLDDPASFFVSVKSDIEKLETLDSAAAESIIRGYAEKLDVGAGKIIHPLRAALSGRAKGPSMFDMMEVMGKDRVIKRLDRTIAKFK